MSLQDRTVGSKSTHTSSSTSSSTETSAKRRTIEATRWFWTLHYVDSVGYEHYPVKDGSYPVLHEASGPRPKDLVVSFVSYQEEVCPETGLRHLQGFCEVGMNCV